MNSTTPNAHERSTAELVHDLTDQFSRLTRAEIRLAVREVRDKAKHAGVGLVGVGAAGLLALYGLAVVIAGLVLVLALALPAWASALIVGVVLFAVAGVVALLAKRQLQQGVPPVPTAAVESAKEDVQVVKEAVKR